MGEIELMRELQARASRLGARLFRQNVGMAWVGATFERVSARGMRLLNPGDVIVRKARAFHAGHAGMSDLGGWAPVTITADMVGQTVAVYAQVEVKAGARVTEDQQRWIDAVSRAGGYAGVARSHDDLAKILRIAPM